MTVFLRLLTEEDKGAGLYTACARLRQGCNPSSAPLSH
jgi:hypothetical protein